MGSLKISGVSLSVVLFQNTTETVIQAPEVSISLTNLSDIWTLIKKAKSFDFDIIGFVNENLGMVMSVSEMCQGRKF